MGAAHLNLSLLPLGQCRVCLAKSLLLAPGALVYLLRDNNFDSVYYQVNNLTPKKSNKKIETEKREIPDMA